MLVGGIDYNLTLRRPAICVFLDWKELNKMTFYAQHRRATLTIAINQPRTSYFVGGSEVVSLEHAKSWLKRGCKVVFYTIDPTSINMPYSELFNGFREEFANHPALYLRELQQDPKAASIYRTIPGENKTRWYTEAMFYNRPLFKSLLQEDLSIDILFSYYQFDALTIPSHKVGKNVLYLSGIPNSDNSLRPSQLAMYDQLFAISQPTCDYWQRYTDQRIDVIPTGVAIPKKSHSTAFAKDDTYLIIFAGRLIERKGCTHLIEAIADLPEELRYKVKLIILGDGPQRQAIKHLVHTNNLESQIELMGVVQNPIDFFLKADLCIFPSLRGEGLMGVILEAMAAGACVISTYNNGTEPLFDNERGVLFKSGDVTALSAIMGDLLANPSKRSAIGQAAREFVSRFYSWDQQITKLYARMVV